MTALAFRGTPSVVREGLLRRGHFTNSRKQGRLRSFVWLWLGALTSACNEGPKPRPSGNAEASQLTPTTTSGSVLPTRVSGEPRAERGGAYETSRAERPAPTFERWGYARPAAQVLACGPLGFVRLTEPGFEVYSYRTLTRTARYREGAFTHVAQQPGYSFLFVGAGPSLLYYHANPRLTSLGHLHALGPFTLWADQQDRERVWVHYLKDDAVHHFALPRQTDRAGALIGSVSLPNFDGTLLARLTAGQWIYAAYSESGDVEPGAAAPSARIQLRLVDGARTAWLGGYPAQTEAIVPGPRGSAWLLSRRRALGYELSAFDRLEPAGAVDLVGEPWAAANEGSRLVVLSQTTTNGASRWFVQVIEAGKVSAPLPVSLEDAGDISAASRRAVCLVPGRPWVVVGGPKELRVLDYATGAELLTR